MISKLFSLFLLFLLLLFLLLPGMALNENIKTVTSSGSGSDQNIINAALSGGGTVYLSSANGPFVIDNTVIIESNTILTGDSDAIILVSPASSQWFVGLVGIIGSSGPVDNVVISGFQIDGSCDELPASYSDSSSATKHDCGRAIVIKGSSGQFSNNIIIKNMRIYNCFSDGIHIRFAYDVQCLNNFVSNCQHSGIYFVSVVRGLVEGCKVDGIGSDDLRYDNCVDQIFRNNFFNTYRGQDSNGAYQGGQNLVQIADQGYSHGGGSDKPTHTTNIEGYNNTFVNGALRSVWVDSTGKGVTNVFLHDNIFIDGKDIIINGVPVSEMNYNYTNPPTKEMSEDIFTSLFDILDRKFTDSGRTEQKGEDIQYSVQKTESGMISGGIKILGFKDVVKIDNVSYIPDEKSVLVKYEAIKSPSLNFFGTGIEKIDNKVDTQIKDGKANAVFTVTTRYYTVSTNHITKTAKKNFKTTTATFEDSYSPAPAILNRSTTTKAYVNVFNDTKNPVAKVRIDHTNTTQLIEFTYGENKTTHKFMIGERITDQAGVQYTAYSRCDIWNGSIQHMGDELVIIGFFDPAQLHIKYYTPYEVSEVKDIEIIYNKTEGESTFMATLKFIVYILFAMFAGYQIMKIVI